MATFVKSKTEYVLKANGHSLEFPTYRHADTYRKKFLKLFPDVDVVMFKVTIYNEKIS